MRKKSSLSDWHYRRLVSKYDTRTAVILNGILDTHRHLVAGLDGPSAGTAEGRSLRRRFFRSVLTDEMASYLVRKPSVVRELLSHYVRRGQPIPLDEREMPIFPVVEVEEP